MRRADHYVEAERLVERAVQRIAQCATEKYPLNGRETARADALLDLRAALVHATLAAAGPGVEQEVIDQATRDTNAANWAAGEYERMTQVERQAARPRLPKADQAPKPGPPR